MDPISLGLMIAGTALTAGGGIGGIFSGKRQSEISYGMAQDERAINEQKHQAMLLQAKRSQLEVFRNQQRARSMSQNAAVNQGAQFGSGLQGGLAQINDQTGVNSLGISQNLEIGENIFGLNADLSSKKMQMANAQSNSAMDQGLMSLGQAMVKAGPTVGAFGKQIGSMDFGWTMGGGSPSGYGRG